jgi:hypothetical protein
MENDLNEGFEILDLTALREKYFLLGLFFSSSPNTVLEWKYVVAKIPM